MLKLNYGAEAGWAKMKYGTQLVVYYNLKKRVIFVQEFWQWQSKWWLNSVHTFNVEPKLLANKVDVEHERNRKSK